MSSLPRRALTGAAALLMVLTGAPAAAGTAPAAPRHVLSAAADCPADKPMPGPNRYPRRAAPMAMGSHFSFPNRSTAQRVAIRNRVIHTIDSTWGRYYTPRRESPIPGCGATVTGWNVKRGTIRMATWSFNDWGVRDALVRAANRGVSVQIIAARGVNAEENYRPWSSVRSFLRTHPGDAHIRGTSSRNYAYECSGACRGRGGSPHSKYFLFTDVRHRSNAHLRNVVIQSSMNLTRFAYKGQWNHATALYNRDSVHRRYNQVFRQSAAKQVHGYESTSNDGFVNSFYPGGSLSRDPVRAALNHVRCTGAATGNGRTRVRLIQYAIYAARGNAIAKKLRGLWNNGCDVKVIYSVSSRPVLKILRSKAGRGRIPVRQSVIRNRRGEIAKYNHSKWLGIAGYYAGRSRGTWTVLSGSANLSDAAYRSDEQMQQAFGHRWANPFFRNFNATWRQKTSKVPKYGRVTATARMLPEQPIFGRGVYRYLSEGE